MTTDKSYLQESWVIKSVAEGRYKRTHGQLRVLKREELLLPWHLQALKCDVAWDYV